MEKNLIEGNSPRREFLGQLATGVAALGVASFLPTQTQAEPLPAAESDDAWFKKLKGKHRMAFDAISHHDSFPLAWARVFLSTNNDTGVPDTDCGVIVILRHDAIPLAMEDKLWAKYKFGEVFKIEDKATKAPAVRNIYWQPKPGELHFPDMSIDQLQKRGVMFCVCNMAITVYSMIIAKNMGLNADDVKKDFLSGIYKDIQLVPSGVWAVNRAQEVGCSYCFAG